jgi:hypothetical protein
MVIRKHSGETSYRAHKLKSLHLETITKMVLLVPIQIPFSCRLIALNSYIWYSERVERLSHKLIKEKLMPEPRTCHLPNSTALFCVGVARFGLAEAQLRLCSAIVVVSDIPGLGRWR